MVQLVQSQPFISCRRSLDHERVRETAIALWSEMNEPGLPNPIPLTDEWLRQFVFIEVLVDDNPSGFFALRGNEFHALLMPTVRGRLALRAAERCFEWIRDNIGHVHLTAFSHRGRAHVRWYAHRIGFTDGQSDAQYDHYIKEL